MDREKRLEVCGVKCHFCKSSAHFNQNGAWTCGKCRNKKKMIKVYESPSKMLKEMEETSGIN